MCCFTSDFRSLAQTLSYAPKATSQNYSWLFVQRPHPLLAPQFNANRFSVESATVQTSDFHHNIATSDTASTVWSSVCQVSQPGQLSLCRQMSMNYVPGPDISPSPPDQKLILQVSARHLFSIFAESAILSLKAQFSDFPRQFF